MTCSASPPDVLFGGISESMKLGDQLDRCVSETVQPGFDSGRSGHGSTRYRWAVLILNLYLSLTGGTRAICMHAGWEVL